MKMIRHRALFSYVEFFIILTVLLVVFSLVNPTVSNLIQNARNTQCLSHQQKVHMGLQLYAEDHRGILLPVRARRVQINIGAAQIEAMPIAGMAEKHNDTWQATEWWNCPSRDYQSQQEGANFVLSYQYFGGITHWFNPWGRFLANSPVNFGQSQPKWVLAADTTAKIDRQWGAGRRSSYQGMPSHKLKNSIYPAGSNQVYVDGSAEWVDFADLIFVHTWSIDGTRNFYISQKDLGSFLPGTDAKISYE